MPRRLQHILLVEDDIFQSGAIINRLRNEYGLAAHQIQLVETECEFRHWLVKQYKGRPTPDVIVMGMMMPWCELDCPKPDECTHEAHAGLRCRDRLRQNMFTKEVPVVFYTVLETSDLPNDAVLEDSRTAFVTKDAGQSFALAMAIDRLTANNRHAVNV